jgi:hypothetical protein
MEGLSDPPEPSEKLVGVRPELSTEDRRAPPPPRATTKTSLRPLVSPPARLVAGVQKARTDPSPERTASDTARSGVGEAMVCDRPPPVGETVHQPLLAVFRKATVLPSPEIEGTPLQPSLTGASMVASTPVSTSVAKMVRRM